MKRPAALILVAVAAAVLALGRPPTATAAVDRLPDLGMARLRDLSIDTTTRPGHWLLRFTTIILTSSPPSTVGIPAAPLMRRLGGFLLRWQRPGVALG
jgi:hypothetical protein